MDPGSDAGGEGWPVTVMSWPHTGQVKVAGGLLTGSYHRDLVKLRRRGTVPERQTSSHDSSP